jgi:uncharacterized protein
MAPASRRDFLKQSAAFTGGALLLNSVPSWATANQTVKMPLSVFQYSQVQLLEGILRTQFEENHRTFLNLDEDGLLKPFRQREGMAAPGPDLGGWYDNSDDFNPENNFHGFIPGHTFGQYVSGLARAYAITGDQRTREKVHRLVQGFAATVEPKGKFYVDYRLPAYTFDKTCCGLIDAHEFARDPQALEVLRRSTAAALPHLPEKALSRAEQEARPHKGIAYTWDESYTLPENLFLAYQRSGDPRYRELARRFIYHEFYDALAEEHNVFPGKHAYSHVNTLSSAMQAYFDSGDAKYLRAATNGLRMVQEQSYATGGWGPSEGFVEPGNGLLGASLDKTHASFETPCGAYGHFKITRYLLRLTRDSRYGDSMERVLYNTIAGAKPIKPDGESFYYSDYNNRDAKKVYNKDKWPCCSGTFPQLAADYGISAYYASADGVYVNLFIPSKLTWPQNKSRCTLTQITDYPTTDSVELRLDTQRPEKFVIYLRVPEWAGYSSRVSINGKKMEESLAPGTFFAIDRVWKSGDRVEYEIGMPLRLESVDKQNPNVVALVRGPLAMFAVGGVPADFDRKDLLQAEAVSTTSEDWNVKDEAGLIRFRPFASIKDEPYRLYHKVKL